MKEPVILKHRQEFVEVLTGYEPSNESLRLFRKMPIVLLVGPTAAGRNTLINMLQATGRFRMIVSDSTRRPRIVNGQVEENGKVYWFKTEEDVLQGLRHGRYIEAAILHNQQVSGASIDEIKGASDSGKIALKEIDVVGAANYRRYKSDILCIFLLPPDFGVWMQRIKERGGIDKAEMFRRLTSAIQEIEEALNQDYYQFVVNEEIHSAARAVDELANGRVVDSEKQKQGRKQAKQLLEQTRQYLSTNQT